MKKLNPVRAATPKSNPQAELKTMSAPLPPHPTIHKVQTPALDPAFSRLYLASLIGRQRS